MQYKIGDLQLREVERRPALSIPDPLFPYDIKTIFRFKFKWTSNSSYKFAFPYNIAILECTVFMKNEFFV